MNILLMSLFLRLMTLQYIEAVAIEAITGSTVHLVCSHKHNGTGTLQWSFKSTTSSFFIMYTNNAVVSPQLPPKLNQRLNLTGNHTIGEYNLNIFDIRDSDQGTYACLVSPSGDRNTQNLTVIVKPNITHFSPDTLDTEETTSFNISCQSYGSRPTANIYWLFGQNSNVTSNSSTKAMHDLSTNTYTVTSTLKYRVDRRYNGHKLICRASNVAGYVETSLTLIVKYAPTVNVENKTFSYNQSQRQIRSTLDGNPTTNMCTWHHRSKYGEHIRDFIVYNQTLTLPTVPKDQWYQDTGEYVCTTENGIKDQNGQVKQIGSGYVTSNAPPVITADNEDNIIQYGTLGQNTELKINVYSIPKYFNIRWYKGSILLGPKKYITTEEPAMVKDMFHGVNVHLDGYRVTLRITDLQEADFTTYTIRLYYGNQDVVHNVTLKSVEANTAANTDVIIGATTGVLAALMIVCIIIILVFKSKKGKVHNDRSTKTNIFQ